MATSDPFAALPLEIQCIVLRHLPSISLHAVTRASRALCSAASGCTVLKQRLFCYHLGEKPAVWKFLVDEQRVEKVASISRQRNTSEWTAEVYTMNPILFEPSKNPEDLFFRMFDTHQPEFRLCAQRLAHIHHDAEDVLPFSPKSMYLTQPPVTAASIKMVVAEASLIAWNISSEGGLKMADIVELLNTIALPQLELPGVTISLHKAICLPESAQIGMEEVGSSRRARVRLCPTPSPISPFLDEYVERVRIAFRDARYTPGPLLNSGITTRKLKIPITRSLHSFYPPPSMIFTNIVGSCIQQKWYIWPGELRRIDLENSFAHSNIHVYLNAAMKSHLSLNTALVKTAQRCGAPIISSWLSNKKRAFLSKVKRFGITSSSQDTGVGILQTFPLREPEDPALYCLRELFFLGARYRRDSCTTSAANDQYLAQLINHIHTLLASQSGQSGEPVLLSEKIHACETIPRADDSQLCRHLTNVPSSWTQILALRDLLETCSDLESFSGGLWKRFEHCRMDIYTTCLSTNLAIREMRRLCLDFSSKYPALDSVHAVQRFLRQEEELVKEVWELSPTDPSFRTTTRKSWSDLLHEDLLNWLEDRLEITQNQVTGNFQSTDTSCDNATLAIASVAAMKASYISLQREDCLMDGISTACEDNIVPLWLLGALSAHAPMFEKMAGKITRCWGLQETCFRNVVQGVDMAAEHHASEQLGCFEPVLKACKSWLGAQDSMPSLRACLQRFPAAACGIGYQIKLDAYLGALNYCNQLPHFIIVAHIYRACKRSNLLGDAKWDDLEYVLETHKRGLSCFNSASTGCSTPVASTDSMWTTQSGLHLQCIGDLPRLEPPPVLGRLVQRLKTNPGVDFWDLCRLEAMDLGRGTLQRGLDCLIIALDQQRLEFAFDYLHLDANCRGLLLKMQVAFGSDDITEIMTTLLTADALLQHLHPALRPESDISKMVGILRSFIEDFGRQVRTKATKAVTQSDSSNFVSRSAQLLQTQMATIDRINAA